jgi:hypothetical protein
MARTCRGAPLYSTDKRGLVVSARGASVVAAKCNYPVSARVPPVLSVFALRRARNAGKTYKLRCRALREAAVATKLECMTDFEAGLFIALDDLDTIVSVLSWCVGICAAHTPRYNIFMMKATAGAIG